MPAKSEQKDRTSAVDRGHKTSDFVPKSAPAEPEPAPPTASPFTIELTDKNGKVIRGSDNRPHDPSAPEARGIFYDVHVTVAEPSASTMELYQDLAKIELALQCLYPDTDPANEAKFRPLFVRLFWLTHLILEGDTSLGSGAAEPGRRLSTETARSELNAFASELIDKEGPRVKNGHIQQLVRWAVKLAVPFIVVYVALKVLPGDSQIIEYVRALAFNPPAVANLMLLWLGSFVGVCLSYAIRTQKMTLADLTKTDKDYLAPEIRLMLGGAFATLLALIALAGLGDIRIADISLSEIWSKPVLAFVVGAVLGLSEYKLPGTIQKHVGELFDKKLK